MAKKTGSKPMTKTEIMRAISETTGLPKKDVVAVVESLTEEIGKAEAEEVITYHARGLRDQVEELIRDEFPTLWAGFDARTDIRGRFIGPGKDWEDPPREIGTWLEGEFSWEQ